MSLSSPSRPKLPRYTGTRSVDARWKQLEKNSTAPRKKSSKIGVKGPKPNALGPDSDILKVSKFWIRRGHWGTKPYYSCSADGGEQKAIAGVEDCLNYDRLAGCYVTLDDAQTCRDLVINLQGWGWGWGAGGGAFSCSPDLHNMTASRPQPSPD